MTLRGLLSRLTPRRSVGVAGCAVVTAGVVVLGVLVVGHRQAEAAQPPAETSTASASTLANGRDGATFALDLAATPDGQLPSRLGDTTITTVEAGRSASPLRVIAAWLQHGQPIDTDASSFVVAALQQPITRIGANIAFPAYSGSVALTAWESAPTAEGVQPAAGIHVVVGPGRWEMSVWDPAAGRVVLAGGNYAAAQPETPQTFEVIRNGDTAVLTMPDGQRHSVTDPRVDAWTGTFAAWELYEFQPGIRPASIASMWAS